MPTRQEHIAGGLVGLLIGDALGVPYEFHPPREIPPLDAIEFDPPPGFRRAHYGVPPGTWSDDGAQALCLLDSLLACGMFDADDFGHRLVRWYDDGYLAVGNDRFDVGIQTSEALMAIKVGATTATARYTDERANGNGSLMRVLPLALWHRGSDDTLVADAQAQSRVTHGHLRSQVCCAYYCLWARRILEGAADPWAEAAASLRRIYAYDPAALHELNTSIRPDDPPPGEGRGYVVDCLHSARTALAAGPYESVVKAAVAFGSDTDTTACVAGGLAGVREGIGAIPERWVTGLRGKELYQPLLDQLLERV